MLFPEDQIHNALLRAKENLLFDIKEHGIKVVDTQDIDVLEDLHDIEQVALTDALTNPDTKHQALRRYLWQMIFDDALQSACEDLRDVLEIMKKELMK